MISPEQYPILIVVIPLLSAFVINILGGMDKRFCYPATVLALAGSLAAATATLCRVASHGVIHYRLGGWAPPFGIEYVVDHLNALVLVVVAFVAFVAAIASKRSVAEELPHKINQFYTLFILLTTGLLGMTITGDAFNLYVLMEISALTNYALIAMGRNRALMASFNYVVIGTIGACFYLLGVGHLYIMTGSLNMADILTILPSLYGTNAILVAAILMLMGAWIKMAFFPMHGWLPNAYTYAPSATSSLVAPLMTKVSVYIMIRVMFSVLGAAYVFTVLPVKELIVWLATVAIVGGSLFALSQKDFKRMLTYLIVAEVGYMVGGAWLATEQGITGAILHIVNDAVMTLCLFLFAAIVVYKTKGHQLSNLQGLFKKMPVTMGAFAVGALSMIGVPPTAGFFSKWYLILGGIDAGQWQFVVALLFSSLVNAVLFFRIFEIAYYEPESDQHGHGDSVAIDEAPLSMLLPLVAVAITIILLGLYSGEIVTTFIQHAVPAGI
ncbi:monovalent cation/H+ antiporter subunit D family protein [Thermodesulfobacteriota bacterium]